MKLLVVQATADGTILEVVGHLHTLTNLRRWGRERRKERLLSLVRVLGEGSGQHLFGRVLTNARLLEHLVPSKL